MRPYFAKYLPVKGVITIGDKFFHKGKVKTYTSGSFPSECHKAALFICITKIFYGDPTIGTYIDIDRKGLGSFKATQIVGEVSKDALNYVKEGQRFNEDEIHRQWYDDSGDYDAGWTQYFKNEYMGSWEELECDKRVQIKASCGHFH